MRVDRSGGWRRVSIPLMLCASLLTGAIGCATTETTKRAEGYYREGLSMLNTDQQQAFVSFQKAILENPRHKEAHYYLGHVYAKLVRYREAEREFRTVIELDPDYSEAYTYLGQILARLDRWDESIQSYRLALTNPLYVTPDLARFHLGRALAHQREYDEAIRVFEDALLISPPSVPRKALHLELGRAYYKLGEDGKARKALTRVTRLDEEGPYAKAAGELLGRLRP